MANGDEPDDFNAARAELFEAISHPVRIRILQSLKEKPMGFAELRRAVGLESGGHLSFHLNKLRHLVKPSAEGLYTLTDDGREALWSADSLAKSNNSRNTMKNTRRGFNKQKVIIASVLILALIFGGASAYQVGLRGNLGGHSAATITTTTTGQITSSGSSTTPAAIGGPLSTSITLVCNPSAIAVNTATTCVATVNDTGAVAPTTPKGAVAFSSEGSGAFSSSTCRLNEVSLFSANCQIAYTPGMSSEGTQNLQASYLGDAGHSASSSSAFTLSATKRMSSTSVTCSPDSLVVDEMTKCTATVSDTNGGVAMMPTGSVAFDSDNSGIFTPSICQLAEASTDVSDCSVSYAPVPGGEGILHVGASYSSDTDHSGSTASTFALNATVRTTSVILSCSPSSTMVGGTTACSVTVTDTSAGTPTTPTGSISFSSDNFGSFGSTTCSPKEISTGTASCQATYTPSVGSEGTHQIRASYGGDVDHSGSSAVGFTIVATAWTTSTSLSCSPSSLSDNSPTICTATVANVNQGNTVAPTGMISLSTDKAGTFNSTICRLSVASSSPASCSVSYIPGIGNAGIHDIGASYGGDANHSPSSASPFPLAAAPAKYLMMSGSSTFTGNSSDFVVGGTTVIINSSASVYCSFDAVRCFPPGGSAGVSWSLFEVGVQTPIACNGSVCSGLTIGAAYYIHVVAYVSTYTDWSGFWKVTVSEPS